MKKSFLLIALSVAICFVFSAPSAQAWWIFGGKDKKVQQIEKTPSQSETSLGQPPSATLTFKEPSKEFQAGPLQAKPRFGIIMRKSGGFPPGLANDRTRAEITQKFWDLYNLSAAILNVISNPNFQSFTGQDLKNQTSPIRILIDNLVMSCREPESTPMAVRICGGLQKYVSLLSELSGITALDEVYEQPCNNPSVRYSLVPPLNCYAEYINEKIEPFVGRFQTLILWGDPSAPDYSRPTDFEICPLNADAYNTANQNVLCSAVCMQGRQIVGETGTTCSCNWRNAFDTKLVPLIESYKEMGRYFVMYLSGNGAGYSGWDPAEPRNAPPAATIVE